MEDQKNTMLDRVAQVIYDKKGFNILALDVRNISSIAEYFIIAEGTVERHVQALAREVVDIVHKMGLPIFHLEGEKEGDWIVIDCGNLMIHLFVAQLREKYSLEELWCESQIVNLNLNVEKDER